MSNQRIILKNVRLSFPSLFRREVFSGKEGKFAATFLIPKTDKKLKREIDKAITAALTEAKIKVPSDKYCIRDGDDRDYNGYADHWAIKASNRTRPQLLNRDKSQLIEEDGILYSGCYVNAIIDIWIQNNKEGGKRVNANLYGVQFLRDGDPFATGNIDVTDEFDDCSDDEFDEDELL